MTLSPLLLPTSDDPTTWRDWVRSRSTAELDRARELVETVRTLPPDDPRAVLRAWDEAGLFRLGRAYEAITRDADWRSIEPHDLMRLEDPATAAPGERSEVTAG